MMIDKYWGTYFGLSRDSETLVRYLDTKGEVLTTTEIFHDLGLDALEGNFTDASIDATVGDHTYHFDYAFHIIMDLSVLLLESSTVGRFNLARIGGSQSRAMRIDSASKEHMQITQALKYFSLMPEEHAVSEEYDDDQLLEIGNLCEEIRLRLD